MSTYGCGVAGADPAERDRFRWRNIAAAVLLLFSYSSLAAWSGCPLMSTAQPR